MKVNNIPILITFITCLFPLLGALLNLNIYTLPAALVVVAASLLYSQQRILVVNNSLITLAAPAMLLLIVVQLVTGRGFVTLATGGFVIIFAIVFLNLFLKGGASSPMSIVRGISFLYKFFLITMLIEMILIMLGLQPQLRSILMAANSPGYKTYNSADVLRYFGLMQNSGGLNSILLGSQISGMLSLFSTIWFIGIKKFKQYEPLAGHSGSWIFLSLVMLIITINGTNSILLALACILYLLFFKKINWVMAISLFGLLVVGIYLLIDNGLIFTRIFNQKLVRLGPGLAEIASTHGILDDLKSMTTLEYYIFVYFTPIENWLSEGWENKLLGVGRLYFVNQYDHPFLTGDFGLGMGLLTSGLLWISILLLTVVGTCIAALKDAKEQNPWSAFGAMNALITILWLASTIHYNQAFSNPGGMTLFALHFSVTLYCRYRSSIFKSAFQARRSNDSPLKSAFLGADNLAGYQGNRHLPKML